MKKTMKLTWGAIAIFVAIIALSTSSIAQEGAVDKTKKAEAEMETAFGTVPVMFEVFPDHLRAGAWEWFKSTMSPEASLQSKDIQLIALAVASQIPCDYCVYAHKTMARMFGATDAEISEAIAAAAETRHWSTVLNGAEVPLDDFKQEWDGILAHLKAQMTSAEGAGE